MQIAPIFTRELGTGVLGEGMYRHARARLPIYSWQELVDDYHRSGEESAKKLLRVVLASSREYDKFVFGIVENAMCSAERELRQAAVYATSYNPVREYLPLLLERTDQDSDEEVRSDSQTMIDIYRESGLDKS